MKKWWKSKTLLVNGLLIVGMVAEYLLANQLYSPELHVLVLGVINILLRMVTNTGIGK